MSSPTEKAVIKTLAYADVFDWPLRSEEIWKWLIKCNNATMQQCNNALGKTKIIEEKGGLYFLKGRENITKLRQRREKRSKEKFKIVQRVVTFLKWIPTIRLIGITGALAISNVREDDDIDLLIVTSPNFLWTTRFVTTILVEILDKRRHPNDTLVNNKICLNMFLDEDHLTLPKEEQDLFSAHEVVQMKPLYNKGKTYQKFLRVNQWVERFLPNAVEIKYAVKTPREWQAESHDSPEVEGLRDLFFNLLERFLKSLQLWYMRKRRTTEKISNKFIRFHPHDAREWVLKAYRQKLFRYSP